jgi:hypothetical protein
MSLTKRYLDDLRIARERQEKQTCGCYYNWDDKTEVLCDRHERERMAYEEQAAYDAHIYS